MNLKFWKKKEVEPVVSSEVDDSKAPMPPIFSTHVVAQREKLRRTIENAAPKMPEFSPTFAADSSSTALLASTKQAFSLSSNQANEQLLSWYVSQGFIGYQSCALLSQQWLVSKACSMPGEDAIKKGYKLTVNDGEDVDPAIIKHLERKDKLWRTKEALKQFDANRRIFGIRIAVPIINSDDKDFYEKPFNIDGVKPGTYKGMSQVDPYWITPELDAAAVANPDSLFFYEPTYWRVSGKRMHRSHLIITRYKEVPDVLKPTYQYGGLPLTQLIYERIYAAERTANEAPLLAMSKRLTVLHADLDAAAADPARFGEVMAAWVGFRDNFGVNIVGEEEKIEQFDTNLGDLDATIMTQYQIVAAIAGVPATKLLETSPKGFNATGEHEISSYNDRLEGVQEYVFEPFLDRHYLLLAKSEIEPQFNIKVNIDVTWEPLTSMSSKEMAEINEANSRTDKNLFDMGAIDGVDCRDRLIADENSGYSGMAPYEDVPEPNDSTNIENGVNEVLAKSNIGREKAE